MSKISRVFAIAAITSISIVGLTACASNNAEYDPNTKPNSIIDPVQAPVTVDGPYVLAGQTQEIKVGQVLNINSDTPENWVGQVAKANVATFVNGGTDGQSVRNFGFVGVMAGETEAVVSNVETGEMINFKIKVVK